MANKNGEVIISIDEENGEMMFVHDADMAVALSDVGGVSKTRATHVEPVNAILRGLFYFVRNRVDDDGWIAGVTRKVPCMWRARLLDTGEVIGVGRNRAKLIELEVEHLENERI